MKGTAHLDHGDARNIDSLWVEAAGDRKPDVIVTSPPYGNLKDYGGDAQIGHGQSYAEYLDDMEDVFRGLAKVSSRTTTLWLIVDTFRDKDPVAGVWALRQVPADLTHLAGQHGWVARDIVIWEKGRTLPWSGAGRLRNSFEYVLMFVRGPDFTYNVDEIREPVRTDGWWKKWPERHHPSGSVPTNVWSIPIPIQGSWRTDADHACPLPPELARRLVVLSSNPGDAVLDPFAGTGTVLAVAADLGRDAFGFDLSVESVEQFAINRDNVRRTLERAEMPAHVTPQDVIQARRMKFASRVLALLRESGFNPLLADVSNDRSESSLRASLDLVIVFEPNERRPTRDELVVHWSKAPLTKFGLDVTPKLTSTRSWMKVRRGSRLYEPTGHGFSKVQRCQNLRETRRKALQRNGPFVVCGDPPPAYVAVSGEPPT